MSQFSALSRANREMQLDSWVPVSIDLATCLRIYRDHMDEMEEFQTGDTAGTVRAFLSHWCRQYSKGGFAASTDRFLFKRPSEAVRFKITWGGK